MMQAQWHETRAHVMQNYQCIVRLSVKLRFLLGLAHRIAEVNGILGFPQTRETLGLLAAKSSAIEGLVIAMEAQGEDFRGTFVPDRRLLVTAQVLAQTTYPEFIDAIRGLSGGGLVMVPSSSADFDGGEVERMIQASQRSPVAGSEERVKLMKLAWDAIGSEFGSRHLQYEMFYSGPQFAIRGNSYRFHDWAGPKRMVQDFMDSYALDRAAPRAAAE
jgi:4-hydroxyphenylacetate 3-monooxygenase